MGVEVLLGQGGTGLDTQGCAGEEVEVGGGGGVWWGWRFCLAREAQDLICKAVQVRRWRWGEGEGFGGGGGGGFARPGRHRT